MPLHDTLWAMTPDAAEALIPVLARETQRPQEPPSTPSASLSAPAREEAKGYTVSRGVAVIPITGPITRSSVYSWWSGAKLTTGQDEIAETLDKALADPSARAILFRVNSPGGTVHGTKELADKIAEASSVKPMAAYADGLMASAAMWLGASAGKVYAPVTAEVGSVGVIMAVADWSKAHEKYGVTVTYITGGKLKSAGYPGQPLSEEARDHFQKQVEQIHAIFKADVVRGLGVTAPAEAWAEGQTLLAGEAQTLGLVTTIVRDLSSAITQLNQEAAMDYATLAAQHPDLLAHIEQQALQKSEAEQQAKLEEARTQARTQATGDILAMVKTVAGEALHSTLETLVKGGATPELVAALAPQLAAIANPSPDTAEAAARARILAGLDAAANKAVEGGSPAPKPNTSRLVADAERRAASRQGA